MRGRASSVGTLKNGDQRSADTIITSGCCTQIYLARVYHGRRCKYREYREEENARTSVEYRIREFVRVYVRARAVQLNVHAKKSR